MITAEPPQPADAPAGARRAADIVDIDLTVGATFADGVPHDAFDLLRAAGGVEWHDEPPVDPSIPQTFIRFVDSPGFFSVTGHALVNEVLRDSDRFSSELGGTTMPSLHPESLPIFRAMMLNMDAPDHTRLRRILQPSFTPKAVHTGLHDAVALNAVEIIDELGAADRCELVTAVSAEMPLRVLADLLGMPREDRHLIFEWSNALLDAEAPPDATSDATPGAGRAADVATTMAELMDYGLAMAADRRATPRDDIVSLIANAEIDGDRLDDNEFAMFWLMLIVAGNETTRSAISGATIALVQHDLWGWLAAHPEAMDTAIDELLRYVSPVMHFRRTATRDTTLGDQTVRAGDKVIVWYGAANRDPAVFEDPHQLDLRREHNPHLAFGVGAHFCLGSHLARLEVSTMLRALMEHAPGLTLDGPPTRVPSNFVNGVRKLPVLLAP